MAIVNNLSLMALAPLPITPAYAISKAGRVQLDAIPESASGGPGCDGQRRPWAPVDTDMTRGFEIPRPRLNQSPRIFSKDWRMGEEYRMRNCTLSKTRPSGLGTDVVFEITRKGKKNKLRFTHVGLVLPSNATVTAPARGVFLPAACRCWL